MNAVRLYTPVRGEEKSRSNRELTVPSEKAPANYVPAAAVIRRGQALSGFTGCKGRAGVDKSEVKSYSLTVELPLRLSILSTEERDGIPGVVVRYVDIWKNTSGEGDLLVLY